MSFNPDKCEVLRTTNKRNKIMANYYIHGQQLQIVDNAKYPGFIISKNLSVVSFGCCVEGRLG